MHPHLINTAVVVVVVVVGIGVTGDPSKKTDSSTYMHPAAKKREN